MILMPKIDVSYKDLCNLIGKKIPIDKLCEEEILFAKGEIDDVSGDTMKVDIKDTNRPDLWSAEGVAREIRLRHTGRFPEYRMKKSGVSVIVDDSVSAVRPLTACAVVKNLKMNKNALSQLIQLQEKIAGTFGRNRKEVAIGVYDLGKIKPPIHFKAFRPTGLKFKPLDFEKEMHLADIMKHHPKGKEFGHLLKDAQAYPVFIDSGGNVLSMPPIINSDYTGKVAEKTKDVFIECSGFNMKFLITAINVMAAALQERGGKIETVDVVYGKKRITTPDFTEKKFTVDQDYVNRVSGLQLDKKSITKILQKSGYKVKQKGARFELSYPAYRQDIMHQRDVAEDVVITYGMNNLLPESPRLPTTGRAGKQSRIEKRLSEAIVGAGIQEIISYSLTNKRDLFEKMNIPAEKIAEVENTVSINWSVFRNWLTPCLLDFLAHNKHVEYPQKIFEMGICVLLDEISETRSRDVMKLAAAVSNSTVSYEEISSILDVLMKNMGVKYSLKKKDHGSFIDGRCAEVTVNGKHAGIVGEIHPKVLNNWKLEKPVVAFEIDVDSVMN